MTVEILDERKRESFKGPALQVAGKTSEEQYNTAESSLSRSTSGNKAGLWGLGALMGMIGIVTHYNARNTIQSEKALSPVPEEKALIEVNKPEVGIQEPVFLTVEPVIEEGYWVKNYSVKDTLITTAEKPSDAERLLDSSSQNALKRFRDGAKTPNMSDPLSNFQGNRR